MIRMATAADVPAMLAVYGPYVETTAYTFEYTVPTVAEFTARVEKTMEQFPWLVWEEEGCVLGYAYGSAPFERAAYQWCAEVSVYLSPRVQGKGVGRRLYDKLEQLLFAQGYRVIYSLISTENLGSIAFHEALGYRTVCRMDSCGVKFGRWVGIVYMEKRQNAVDIPMKSPTSWQSIGKSNESFQEN